ncbi:hypothetical protein R3J22_02475 [Trueperella bernardiae]|uniref:hypothetical protein n=1 Tax=Trueperella bernardiae TaxID=59561 RepID=UPI002949909D|nr:hypothetical protein [Trueperella bernardiae]MDV6238393.1 hypothetical protein [Trueperella bernardiae]
MTTTTNAETTTAIVIKEHNWEPEAYDFISLLDQLNNGTTIGELDEALKDLLEACKNNGGKGVLTLQITVENTYKDKYETTFKFIDKLTVKTPDAPRAPKVMYADRHGGLHSQNPIYTTEMDALPGLEEDPSVVGIREIRKAVNQ